MKPQNKKIIIQIKSLSETDYPSTDFILRVKINNDAQDDLWKYLYDYDSDSSRWNRVKKVFSYDEAHEFAKQFKTYQDILNYQDKNKKYQSNYTEDIYIEG